MKTTTTTLLVCASLAAAIPADQLERLERRQQAAGGAVEPIAMTAQPTAASSSSTKYVWAHHMVGNTEFYAASNWEADVKAAKAAGIDGFALNMGRDAYQPQNVQWAYDAGASNGLSMFLSFDLTSFPCQTAADASTIADLAKKFAAHPAQAKYQNKVLMSTFAGDACTFGQGDAEKGWAFVRNAIGTETHFVPSTFMTTTAVGQGKWYDGQMHWDAAWPRAGEAPSTKPDEDWMTALAGRTYMAPVSPFFFTYYGPDSWDKNWIYRSDDWLLATRFEQLIGMRDKIDMIELLSWNGECRQSAPHVREGGESDYACSRVTSLLPCVQPPAALLPLPTVRAPLTPDFGESHYLGEITDPKWQPNSTAWTQDMPHTALLPLIKLYADAFRTGSYSSASDGLWLWSRPHPKSAQPTAATLARPNRSDFTDDALYAVTYLTAPATVKIYSGTSTSAWSLQAGLAKLRIPSAPGPIGGEISREDKVVKSFDSGNWKYTDKPKDYNFNYFVGEACVHPSERSADRQDRGRIQVWCASRRRLSRTYARRGAGRRRPRALITRPQATRRSLDGLCSARDRYSVYLYSQYHARCHVYAVARCTPGGNGHS